MKKQKQDTGKITRREFLGKTAAASAGAVIAGAAPSIFFGRKAFAATPAVNFGYILSDHHAPLMVAAKNWEYFRDNGGIYLKPVSEGKIYELFKGDNKIARVNLIPTKKGPDLEKLVAQGSVDMAISGTQSIMLAIDKGVDTKIISPLQAAGNVFVVNKSLPITTWTEFVTYVKNTKEPLKIGMPGPHTVAAIIFRSALDYEGITYTEDSTDKTKEVLFINMKGHGNLVTALVNNLTQAIIGAQPFPAITIDRGVGRLVLNLQDVPPDQKWHGHACCSLEATGPFLSKNPDLALDMMELMVLATETSAKQHDMTSQACAEWLGVKKEVEDMAGKTLVYTTTPSEPWKRSVSIYAETMDGMGMFNGKLKGKKGEELDSAVLDFELLNTAKADLKKKGLL